MMTVYDALNFEQSSALNEETQSVANLLRDAIRAVRRLRVPSVHQDAVFTMASIGAERLLKLAVGVHFLDDEGRWPSINEMKQTGHNLGDLQAKVLEIVEVRGMRTAYVEELVEFLTSSPTLTSLLNALSHYGQGGRFFHLDALGVGNRSDKYMSPSEHWALIEQAAIEEFPEIQAAIDVDFETGLVVLAEHISVLFDKWWFALHRIMLNGSFGPHGKQLGWLVWEIGRPDPFDSR